MESGEAIESAAAPHKTYGVGSRAPEPASDLEAAAELISLQGFAVVKNALAGDEIASLNRKLEDIYVTQCVEIGGEEQLKKLSDDDVVRLPLSYDDEFLQLALHPIITSLAKKILGNSNVLLMQNGIINRPEKIQPQTAWHRDLNYQHFVSSRPLALSALVCLEDFTEETGGTIFLPGSHKVEAMPSAHACRALGVTPCAPVGSIVFFDSMVYHRAGVNTSSVTRRGVNHVIGLPILGQIIDIPKALDGRPLPNDAHHAGYLGYSWNPQESVTSWRRSRL